ncbi:sugar phosphate isomerase/epimerase [Candidatus Pacearchaeota archaeon]|nr:sugar phosphate isomerase/epimerase [Candidatus Pacearchaeota archaeon]
MASDYVGTESFYEGGASSLSPDYGNFVGYRMSGAGLGFSGSVQTANQLGETVNALKQGVKAFEVSLIMPEVVENVPQEHFKEMRALMKLSGVKPSVHGPLLDPAGFDDKGWGGDFVQGDNERRMFDAIEKAHVLDPNGNVPIVFHGSVGTPGPEFRPGKGKERFEVEKTFAINCETKQIVPLEQEYRYRPNEIGSFEANEGKGQLFTPKERVASANESDWDNKMIELAKSNKEVSDIIGKSAKSLEGVYKTAIRNNKGENIDLISGKNLPDFNSDQEKDYNQMRKADIFLDDLRLRFTESFHKAYKYGSDVQRKELKDLAKGYSDVMKRLPDGAVMNPLRKGEIFEESFRNLQHITMQKTIEKDGKPVLDERYGAPKIYKETEGFAMGKSAETFGNLAMRSYEEFGGNAPIIAIENFMPGTAFSSAKKMKELVNSSRDNFVKQLIEDKGLSKSKAKEIAEKQLGVTWDVGHLNMMKKKGFTDKDVLAETKKITADKTMVKHVHLTDNFGFADSHLAPGMGNVPFKKIMEQLEKTGRLGEMRKIVEAGGFVQHFKKSPHGMSMAAFGSPIYGMSAGPYWNQVAEMQGSYFGGYGTLNPQQHHSMYGSGFTTMPIDLGGQMSGDQSRFGGTPMA